MRSSSVASRPQLPSLSPLRGVQTQAFGSGLGPMCLLRRPVERGDAGSPSSDSSPAGCPGKARLRGVQPSRDAPPARWDVPLPGLPLGGAPQRRLFEPFEARGARQAYWAGWVDGRFGERGSFVDNPNLARWENPSERLAYYQGHRAGSRARRDRNSRDSHLCEKQLIG